MQKVDMGGGGGGRGVYYQELMVGLMLATAGYF